LSGWWSWETSARSMALHGPRGAAGLGEAAVLAGLAERGVGDDGEACVGEDEGGAADEGGGYSGHAHAATPTTS
jgi:hypothetical protein